MRYSAGQEDIARSISAGKQTDSVLLNFSKAFDKDTHAFETPM